MQTSDPKPLAQSLVLGMSILVFEFVSGGGLLLCPGQPLPAASLLVEGSAMAQALVEDFACSTAAPVTQLIDARLPHFLTSTAPENTNRVAVTSRVGLQKALADNARFCDATVVVAPESDQQLQLAQEAVAAAGGRLLGCSAEMLAWASDKTASVDRLAAAGIAGPIGFKCVGAPTQMPELPVIVKPNDGAGAEDMQLVRCASEWEAVRWQNRAYRIEAYCQGQPASQAVLCGPAHRQMLAPCRQFIDAENAFSYRGGRVLADGPSANRIGALVGRVLPMLDGAIGYVGIDLVLGAAADGSEDVVIEVNPRLTTSYVGLRAACYGNLAQAMLDVADGKSASVAFPHVPLEFRADGAIVRQSVVVS